MKTDTCGAMDRRGFFASIVAALLAPLTKILPSTENARKVGLFGWQEVTYPVLLSKGELKGYADTLSLPLRPSVFTNVEMEKIFQPILSVVDDDPFQTFVVDTNEVT